MNRMNCGRPPARGSLSAVLGWAAMALVAVATPARLGAQDGGLLSGFNPMGNHDGGFQIYSLTGFAGWESVINPQGGFLPTTAGLSGDEMLGGAGSVGWSRRGQKSN